MKYLIYALVIVVFGVASYFSANGLDAQKQSEQQPGTVPVVRVVDGDTIVVSIEGKEETIRLLGINTPESVDPRKPVQCFGKEATKKLKALVEGKSVLLETDPTQGERDRYQRLLRFVYLPDAQKTFVNGEMVKEGYAYSYQEYPTELIEKLNAFENDARENNRGLWGSCPNDPTNSVERKEVKSMQSDSGEDKDCRDFATQKEAQSYFDQKGGNTTNNVDRLDNNHDGKACDTLK